jgi:Na+/proline symporter
MGTRFNRLHQAPPFLGGWCLFGIVAASMSTADGAILAMGTVFSHNVVRQLGSVVPNLITDANLLNAARLSTIPFTLAATLIATYNQQTGYLLIVAFDIVLATVVVPLFGVFYTETPRPNAAFLAIVFGATTRVVLEFALPKDGFLLLPYDEPEFLDLGEAASTRLPVFIDAPPEEVWNPSEEQCDQPRFEDYTGVGSLTAFFVSLVVFVLVQFLEHHMGGPLFTLPGCQPYQKYAAEAKEEDVTEIADGSKMMEPKDEQPETSKEDKKDKGEGDSAGEEVTA